MIIKLESPDVARLEIQTLSKDAHSGLVDSKEVQEEINVKVREILKLVEKVKVYHEHSRSRS